MILFNLAFIHNSVFASMSHDLCICTLAKGTDGSHMPLTRRTLFAFSIVRNDHRRRRTSRQRDNLIHGSMNSDSVRRARKRTAPCIGHLSIDLPDHHRIGPKRNVNQSSFYFSGPDHYFQRNLAPYDSLSFDYPEIYGVVHLHFLHGCPFFSLASIFAGCTEHELIRH